MTINNVPMVPVISICIPTRSRPENVLRLLESVFSTSDKAEVVFYVDDDDASVKETAKLLSASEIVKPHMKYVNVVVGPRITMSDMWNKCAEKARGEILMLCGDDCVFRTPNWDQQVMDEFAKYPDKIALVYGNDMLHGRAMATHPFIHRNWINTIGRFTPPYFSCDWPDTWLHEVAKMINRISYLPGVVTEHMHPAAGKGTWDEVHRERQRRGTLDNVDALYASKKAERRGEADKLLAEIERRNPETSIELV